MDDLQAMDRDGNGEVDRSEFVTYMLLAMQKVTSDDIDMLNAAFDQLDVTQTGTVNRSDVRAASFVQLLKKRVKDPTSPAKTRRAQQPV